MPRESLYWSAKDRPSRRSAPAALALPLRWDGHEQAYVHRPSGATLEGLIYAAKKRGHSFSINYPAPRRCTFRIKNRS